MQAKRSIRKRKRKALPGQPPSSHEGTLKRFILFAYDTQSDSVFIGPIPLGKAVAPARLEHAEDGYAGNPFMGPALEHVASTGGILDPWKDII
jgi:hypothetical protein